MKKNTQQPIEEITADLDGWDGGHNAEPVKEGQCCGNCNNTVVTLARLVKFVIMKLLKN